RPRLAASVAAQGRFLGTGRSFRRRVSLLRNRTAIVLTSRKRQRRVGASPSLTLPARKLPHVTSPCNPLPSALQKNLNLGEMRQSRSIHRAASHVPARTGRG